ncbi:MAG: PQQ-binding-like beta-propeller repeat protein [Anaerolineaceae bacterium]|nr:PQQ-binding-like beta-propeller repeat protein [Anaerolineaceae bacterium]
MSKWLTGKKAFLKNHIIQFVAILFIVGLIGISYFTQTSFCSSNQATAPVHPLWKIDASTVNAAIIWEYPLTKADGFLATSQSSVAFFRGTSTSPCNDDETIIALNPSTGKEIWRYPVTLLRALFGFNDGYLVSACCSSVVRLDEKGERIWQSALFPNKDLQGRLVLIENKVYSSIDNGHSLDFETGSTLSDRLTPEERNRFDLQYLPQYDLYLRLDQAKILVFRISSGLPTWEIRENFKAIPIISNDMVITFDQSNRVKLIDIQTGYPFGEIQLESSDISSQSSHQNQFATLAAYNKHIFILDSDTSKLIAINLY